MVEVLIFVNVGLLVLGAVTLTIAVFALHRARDYVESAEKRLELLKEGQERIFSFLREERQTPGEAAEGLEREAETKTGVRSVEAKIEDLERELRELRDSRKKALQKQTVSSWAGNSAAKAPTESASTLAQDGPTTETVKDFKEPEPNRPAKETRQGTGFAVRHAHPDDDVSLGRERAKRDGSKGDAPVKIFREHYHRYLENYEGYVKLAERLCKMREDGEVPSGSPAEREWEQKLRRLNDGIQRTTARLDILEQYNPELASDERVTHRAEISRCYSELAEKLPSLENF